MIRLKIKELREKRGIKSTRQLSEMTGIRWNTVDDMEQNKSKTWSPDNLEKIMIALEVVDANEIIEYKKEQEG